MTDVPTSDAPIGAKKRARKRLVKAMLKMYNKTKGADYEYKLGDGGKITGMVVTFDYDLWSEFENAMGVYRQEVKRGT